MTDGILLTKAHRDRNLYQYDTLIVDEAHERSLNIDFTLGLLGRLGQKRKNLKLIITSATIDTKSFPGRLTRHLWLRYRANFTLCRHGTSTGNRNWFLRLDQDWFKIKADSGFKPEAYSCMPTDLKLGSNKDIGPKAFLR